MGKSDRFRCTIAVDEVTSKESIERYGIMTASRMNLRHYTSAVPFGAIAENLVNSHDASLAEPEHLTSPAALLALLNAHGITMTRPATAGDLAGAKRVRVATRGIFEAGSQAVALARLNVLLRRTRANPHMVATADGARVDWVVNVRAGVVASLRSAVALNLARLIADNGFDRLRICGAMPCADVFLDESKSGRQRFCGPRCAARTRVAAYRSRAACR